MGIRFPEANYFIASSRLRPGMDGGYTVATALRAEQFAQYAGVTPTLLTFDFWPDYDLVKAEFVRLGLVAESTPLRNLLQDARRDPGFLRAAAVGAPSATDGSTAKSPDRSAGTRSATELDAAGRPWRTVRTDSAGATLYTDFFDLGGNPLLRVPYISGGADWHRASIEITVFDDEGTPCGALHGFAGLYLAWLDHVLDTSASLPNVIVCESRQLGELLVNSKRDDVRLVHTVHSAHTSAPYEWDSPIEGLWASWLNVVDGFDAVVWLTEAQRTDVERRIGPRDNFWVVPHAVNQVSRAPANRDPNLAVMIGRLAALKRVDDALRALSKVLMNNPRARLEIYGDGPDEGRLKLLVSELGLQQAVTFFGHRADAAASLSSAAALVFTSSYEGQGLVVLEALARGCPVVSYDLNYGPAEMVQNGVSGVLVSNGDVTALGDALASVLGNPEMLARLSDAATASAIRSSPEASIGRMAELFADVVARPRRRRAARVAGRITKRLPEERRSVRNGRDNRI